MWSTKGEGTGRLGRRLRAVVLLLLALALGAIGLGAGSVGLLRVGDGEEARTASGIAAADRVAAQVGITAASGVTVPVGIAAADRVAAQVGITAASWVTGTVGITAASRVAAPVGVAAADGVTTGTVIVGWEGVGEAAFYRIGWVALDDIAVAQAAGREWLDAFIFTDVGNLGSGSMR